MRSTLSLFVLFILLACGNTPPAPPPCLLLTETFQSPTLSYVRNFTYQDDRLISMTYESSVPFPQTYSLLFSYGSNGLVDTVRSVSTPTSGESISVYTYDGSGRLIRTATNGGDTTKFEYNASGQVIRAIFDRYLNDYTREYKYPNTTTTNFSESVNISWNGFRMTETYTYDEKPNPLFRSRAWIEDVLTETENNITKIENDYSSDVVEYTYTYNSRGIPATRTRTSANQVWTYKTSCD